VTNCHWQTVPHDWSGHRERSVAKFCPRTWNRVVGAGRRAEPIEEQLYFYVVIFSSMTMTMNIVSQASESKSAACLQDKNRL